MNNSIQRFLTLALLVSVGLSAGFASSQDNWQACLALLGAIILLECVIFRQFEIDFGWSDRFLGQAFLEMLMSSVAIMPCAANILLVHTLPQELQTPSSVIAFCFSVAVGLNGAHHGMVIVISCAYAVGAYSRHQVDDPHFLEFAVGSVAFLPALITKYRRDFIIVTAIGLLVPMSIVAGDFIEQQPSKGVPYVFICLLTGYVIFVYHRRHRQLPPGLRAAKFVRLGYLRYMLANGKKICRMQDLPPEAFGNFYKAWHVLILSHRWINPFTCDVDNVRLIGVLNQLESHFSLKGFGAGSGVWERLRRMRSSFIGGWDVVIFIDFMCLPQNGVDIHGERISRSSAEESIFFECLPNMGLLYSSFPVLIDSLVPRGVTSYLSSGWCYCELNIARLGRQLATYSFEEVAYLKELQASVEEEKHVQAQLDDMPMVAHVSSRTSMSSGEKDFSCKLPEKNFFNEADRDIVRAIVLDFYRKKRLGLAIADKQVIEVNTILSELDCNRRWALLDQSMDEAQNTALHLAVRNGCLDVVRVLLANGADPKLRNYYGDNPSQWFGWPRVRAAGRFLRNAQVQRQRASLTAVLPWEGIQNEAGAVVYEV